MEAASVGGRRGSRQSGGCMKIEAGKVVTLDYMRRHEGGEKVETTIDEASKRTMTA